MHRLYIAICDDDPQDAALLRRPIEDAFGETVKVVVHDSGEAFLQAHARRPYHLVFMDIYIGDVLGTDIAAKLREMDEAVHIAFATVSEEFTRESYRLGAYGYLIKPPRPEQVCEMVSLAQAKHGRGVAQCVLVTAQGTHTLAQDDIIYVEANGYTSVVHALGGDIQASYTVDALAKLLSGPQFFRCHRSYLVNFDHVARVEDDFIMRGGGIAYIRVKDRRRVRAAYERYLFDRVRDEELP